MVEKRPKTNSSIRKLGIAGLDDLVRLLRAERAAQVRKRRMIPEKYTDSGYVIIQDNGLPCHPNHLTNIFHGFVLDHNLSPITLHGLRHTFASVANNAKIPLVDIGKALGHKDIAITGRIYTHLFDQTYQELLSTVAATIRAG